MSKKGVEIKKAAIRSVVRLIRRYNGVIVMDGDGVERWQSFLMNNEIPLEPTTGQRLTIEGLHFKDELAKAINEVIEENNERVALLQGEVTRENKCSQHTQG